MDYKEFQVDNQLIRIPIPTGYADCLTLINSDQYRWTGKKKSKVSLILDIFKPFYPTVLFWKRLSQYKGWLRPLCGFMYRRACRRYQISMPSSTLIGYGFYIGHGVCITINGGTVIGNNVNVSQCMTIGTSKKTPAIIGDNVYIGPNTCLVDDVVVGSGSTIGAGAVVIKNVPENATVVGIPARVINYDNPGQFIKNPFDAGFKN